MDRVFPGTRPVKEFLEGRPAGRGECVVFFSTVDLPLSSCLLLLPLSLPLSLALASCALAASVGAATTVSSLDGCFEEAFAL